MMPTEDGQKLRHACSTCSRSFSNKRDLVKHQYMHREKPKFFCTHCNKSFTTESNYKRHMNTIQNNDKKRYSCGNCGRLFRRLRDLEGHHESEHKDDKVFRCKVCQAEFSWQENLIKHEQVHKANPHICSICGREFIDMTSLLVHRRTHHPPTSTESPKMAARTASKNSTQQQQVQVEEKPFTCPICGRGFKFDFSYQAHLDAHVVVPEKEMPKDSGADVVESTSNMVKPVYVQMDSEGIIDLPAFGNPNDEEVEIIVEVGNVSASSAIEYSLDQSDQMEFESETKEEKDSDTGSSDATKCINGGSNIEGGMADASETVQQQISIGGAAQEGISKTSGTPLDAREKVVSESARFYELKKDQVTDGPPRIDKMKAEHPKTKVETRRIICVPENSYSTRPKKPPKRKRERTPFQFNCVMTDDKPFVCSVCGEAFRWEISLQVHTKAHTDGKIPGIRKMYTSYRASAKRKGKEKNENDGKQEPSVKRSRIVYRRDSSDEEDEEEEEAEADAEDTFAFRNELEEEEEEEESHRGKSSQVTVLAPENADDMLLQYLAGKDAHISLADGDEQADRRNEQKKMESTPKAGRQVSPKEERWKKEKSTDCDSALIPRLCVHG